MRNQHIPRELIEQLRAWVKNNARKSEADTSIVELRQVNTIIDKLRKMSVQVPRDLQRKHEALEAIVNTPSEDEEFLIDLAEQLTSLSKEIKRRIGKSGGGIKAPAKTLRVILPDGRIICEGKAVDTFIKTLKYMGLHNCARITSVVQLGYPVVATEPNSYEGLQPGFIKEVDGYFIEAKTSTDRKAEQLREYAQALGIPLNVESID